MSNTDRLSDAAAINALCDVVRRWSHERGFEALAVYTQVQDKIRAAMPGCPEWAVGTATITPESGMFARKMLNALLTSEGGQDDEVSAWARSAIRRASEDQAAATAQVLDPITLSIAGSMLIGAILAARVKRVGSAEFYPGVPKELADVIKAGASVSLQ